MKRLILGVAAALLLAGPAVADGLPYKGHVKDTETPTPRWTGFYIGGGVGGGAVVHDLNVREYNYYYERWSKVLSLDGIGGEGMFGTIIVGYDRLIRPGWVAGVFVDYDFSDISSSVSDRWDSASINHRHSWSVGARLGMLSSPTTLWYAMAGYTQAQFDFGGDLLDVLVDRYGSSRSRTFDGYFLGAGVESILHGNWSLRLEYRFTQFDGETIYSGVGEDYRTTVDLEPSMHTARLVLTYKLGHRD